MRIPINSDGEGSILRDLDLDDTIVVRNPNVDSFVRRHLWQTLLKVFELLDSIRLASARFSSVADQECETAASGSSQSSVFKIEIGSYSVVLRFRELSAVSWMWNALQMADVRGIGPKGSRGLCKGFEGGKFGKKQQRGRKMGANSGAHALTTIDNLPSRPRGLQTLRERKVWRAFLLPKWGRYGWQWKRKQPEISLNWVKRNCK